MSVNDEKKIRDLSWDYQVKLYHFWNDINRACGDKISTGIETFLRIFSKNTPKELRNECNDLVSKWFNE